MTRKQRRRENRRRHRALKRMKVTTYRDLMANDDRNWTMYDEYVRPWNNPWVKFKGRDRKGRRKTVRFYAKPRRRGKVPKHLRPYLFKSRRRTRRSRRR